jgi:hypothetical protein
MKRYLLILLLTFNASLVVASPLKKVAADTTVDKNTLKKNTALGIGLHHVL